MILHQEPCLAAVTQCLATVKSKQFSLLNVHYCAEE